MIQDGREGQAKDQQKIGKEDAEKEHDIIAFILQNDPDTEPSEKGNPRGEGKGMFLFLPLQVFAKESKRRKRKLPQEAKEADNDDDQDWDNRGLEEGRSIPEGYIGWQGVAGIIKPGAKILQEGIPQQVSC